MRKNRFNYSATAEGQEDLRRRVVDAIEKGLAQTEAARVFARYDKPLDGVGGACGAPGAL